MCKIASEFSDGSRILLTNMNGEPVEYSNEAEAKHQIECFSRTASWGIPDQPKNFRWVVILA